MGLQAHVLSMFGRGLRPLPNIRPATIPRLSRLGAGLFWPKGRGFKPQWSRDELSDIHLPLALWRR
ncbi:MAG: hypothetical protein LBB40_03625 [Holophagales bacterium]|nr:hypothetical protein [Holophagales bacterium]